MLKRLTTPSRFPGETPTADALRARLAIGAQPVAPPWFRCRRAVLAGATAFLSINLWTGSPLLALWVGSQAVGERELSMTAVFVVVLTLLALTLAILAVLIRLDASYRELVGHPLREGRLTWMRSFNAQREPVRHIPTSLLERIVIAAVYIAVIALLVWLLFFAGSSVPDTLQYA